MREVVEFVRRAGPADATVLIEGPSGTGKELVARGLHASGARSRRSFVAVNCAALPDTLVETMLFGHARGAFTGAIARQVGKFELADGGTLFLDEVGELSPLVQAKLLRAIEAGEIDPIGSRQPIRVDVRLVAATNRDLRSAVEDGVFREDLYYRLSVLHVRTPSLAERPEDIPALVGHFLRRRGSGSARDCCEIEPEAMRALVAYAWPGNVRELENVIERAVVLGSGERIGLDALPSHVVQGTAPAFRLPETYYAALHETKRRLLENAFTDAGGDYRRAAEILGLHPNSVHRLLTSLGLVHLVRRRG